MAQINQNTLVPLGIAVICIGSGAIWGAKLDSRVGVVEKNSEAQDNKFSEICRLLNNIDVRLSVLESEIKRIGK